jgi:hypothetical protein
MPQEAPEPKQLLIPKRKFWKFAIAIVGIILFSFAAIVGIAIFEQWRWERRVESAREMMKQTIDKIYQEQLADNIGGKTPQETLRLYIEALERGDYELASKYWIDYKREEHIRELRAIPNIKKYIKLLREVLRGTCGTGPDERYCRFEEPFVVRMGLYPSGVWKILDI